ncbi:MAG: esterase-like activity of phytase family protein [Vicinamibacterales bacterium]
MSPKPRPWRHGLLVLLASAVPACAPRPVPAAMPGAPPAVVRAASVIDSVVFSRPPGERGADVVGGLSGITRRGPDGPWLVVSDAHSPARWYQFRFAMANGRLQVTPGPPTHVRRAVVPDASPEELDLEAIASLPDGTILLSAEGGLEVGGRSPATLLRVRRDGGYVETLPLPEKFLPIDEQHGLRDNLGFEGMTASPDGTHVWAVAEAPLAQDDEPAGLHRGARSRLVEWVRTAAGFRPGREFVYPIEPSGVPPGLGDAPTLASQGPVDLAVLPDGELLVMERAFARNPTTRRGANVIRIFALDLSVADDVSGAVSLREVPDARPVGKRLIVDLADLADQLDPRLATLANFEGMAPGPRTAEGDDTLILVSDDNFVDAQVMAFVLLRLTNAPSRE